MTTPQSSAAGTARRLHPGRRLAFRIGLLLCLGAAAILWFADQLNLHRQRAQLEGLVGVSADRIAETIRRATHDAMLRNDAQGVNRIIENIGAQEGIAHIRIYNKGGRVRTSTVPAEEGTVKDIKSEECIACHQEAQPRAGLERADRMRIFRSPGGGRILGVIAPIYNAPECTTACHVHPASQRVLGILDVQLSMSHADAMLAGSERRMTYALVITVVAVLLLAFLLLWRMVLRPVRRAHRGHGARGRGRPLRARPGRLLRRDGGDGRVLEPDDGRAAAARAARSRAGTGPWSSGWRRRRASWSAPTSR